MSVSQSVVLFIFRVLTKTLCEIDNKAITRIPDHGPLILISNHVNVLEIPLLYTQLLPRPLSGFFAAYRLDSPWMKWLLTTFGGIPIHRGTPDRDALDRAIERILAGDIFGMSPEGTRSGNGVLGPGRAGVVHLATETEAPILPMVHWGSENWQSNLVRFRRTPFHIAVGSPFRVKSSGPIEKTLRDEILQEIMTQMASLLPQKYRGEYDRSMQYSPVHLQFC